MSTPTITNVGHLARADLLLLAARIMSAPGGRASRRPWPTAEALAGLAHHAGPDDPELTESITRCVEQVRVTDGIQWAGEHTRLFDGADKGVIIADLCGFYRAFGFEPAGTSGEKPDHLLCELEFTAMLLVMLAQAEATGEAEAADITRQALRSFLLEHLGEWIGLFCDRLVSTARLPLHESATRLLRSTWDTLAAALMLPTLETLETLAAPLAADEVPEGSPYECGMAANGPAEHVTLTGPPGSGLPERDVRP